MGPGSERETGTVLLHQIFPQIERDEYFCEALVANYANTNLCINDDVIPNR